jgi:hypothetical protein
MMTFDEFRRLYTSPDVSRCLATHSSSQGHVDTPANNVRSEDKERPPGGSVAALNPSPEGLTTHLSKRESAMDESTQQPATREHLQTRITLALSIIGHRCHDPLLAATLTDVLNGKTIEDFLRSGRVA